MNDFLDYMMSDDTATGNLKTLQESTKNRGGSNNLFFRYKRMPDGGTSTIRLLPISQDVAELEARPKFWLPKKVIRLRFENPLQEGSEVVLAIPVLQMFVGGKTEDDIILKQVKALYDEADSLAKKGEEDRAKEIRTTASAHWTRGECLAQGFVTRTGLQEDNQPENPVRLFELNKQIMNIIQAAVNSEDPETRLEFWPVHGKKGSNFVIKKTKSGEWPSYTSSCFSRQTSPWTDEMKAAVGTHGLWNLNDFLPARPGNDEYAMLADIVKMSIAGNRVWDPDYEAHLDKVKVFKTNQTSDDDNATTEARIHQVAASVGAGTASTADIVNSLSRTARKTEEPEVAALGDVEPVEPSETVEQEKLDIKATLDKIKRGATKTATAAAA